MRPIARLGLLICFLCYLALGLKGEVQDVCGLRSVESVVGRVVEISGRLLFTSHGAYILTDGCPKKLPSAALLNPRDPGVPDLGFELDGHAMGRLAPYMRLTGGAAIKCATVSGQFVSKQGFHTRREGPVLEGNGFGPHGALKFAFVLQSVLKVGECPVGKP